MIVGDFDGISEQNVLLIRHVIILYFPSKKVGVDFASGRRRQRQMRADEAHAPPPRRDRQLQGARLGDEGVTALGCQEGAGGGGGAGGA